MCHSVTFQTHTDALQAALSLVQCKNCRKKFKKAAGEEECKTWGANKTTAKAGNRHKKAGTCPAWWFDARFKLSALRLGCVPRVRVRVG